MKILLIGYGKVGSVLATLLAEQPEVEKIICTYRTEKPPEEHPKISFAKCDAASPREVVVLLLQEVVDIVVNSSLPQYNKNILEACLQQHRHYLDLASYWDIDPDPRALSPYKVEQLDYDREFKRNNLLGLINAGVSPGLTNLLASKATALLDEVDSVKIRLLEECKTKQPFLAWSAESSLDELQWKPLVYKQGSFHIKKRFSGKELYTFPPPYGKKKAWLIAQEEIGTIPLFLKVKNCDIKSHDHLLELAREYIDANLDLWKQKWSPLSELEQDAEFLKAVFGVVVDASGKRAGMKKKAKFSVIFPSQKEIRIRKANYITYPTALMTSFFIRSLPMIPKRGVFPPEALDQQAREFILAELKKVEGVKVAGF